ncbi:MAG: hypothetical protein IJ258_07005 [Methanobrevibacter sp.]|uniref:McrB family protein n=1 Tax=Methanobrevibacter sp. TaxID=66852 RepID=UPI0025D53358|nr:hypothetical protein [Methanobrevibacter sp.]MBQ8017840.1 hypothetical protein [Methanobrevibacter sp.]
MSENIQVDSFYRYLISNGYYFDKELIENYLLSLKVKPFEILTGNSGTGKTKLSQLFAKFISSKISHPLIKINLTDSVLNQNRWATIGRDSIKNIFPFEYYEGNYDLTIDGIPAKGSIYLLVQLRYKDEELTNYFQQILDSGKDETYFNINSELVNKFISNVPIPIDHKAEIHQTSNFCSYDNRGKKPEWNLETDFYKYTVFPKSYCEGSIFVNGKEYWAKIRITGKLYYEKDKKIQKHLKQKKDQDVEIIINVDDSFENVPDLTNNYLDLYKIIPIGANWTDNTNIVGYYNVITEDYQSTPAYELIKQAKNDPTNPYFLILDEMNLSHVERYFADFLSAIESGEEIPLYGNNETLKLPDNLFIIGTVNVDETTYMFSPKVLDRANTIEFDTLRAWDYMLSDSSDDDFKGDINYLQSPLEDSDISNLNIEDLKEILSQIYNGEDNLWDTLAMELTGFQETLKDSSFDFGFRVINEILRFMVVAWRYENEPKEWNNWERYFDAQIKQKILPKLHGSEKAIGNVVTNLFNICLVERNNNENPKNFEVTKENSRYYTSALKLQNMAKVLSDQRYVSFIN